jgi:hypothetical protein
MVNLEAAAGNVCNTSINQSSITLNHINQKQQRIHVFPARPSQRLFVDTFDF